MYVGGYFTTAGPIGADNIARWNGATWQPLGQGLNDRVHALALHNGELIAAGDFTASGATPLAHIARWSGSSWQPLGSGLSGGPWPSVRALAVHDGDLFAGGMFETAGGQPAAFVARWDGTGWHPLGDGVGHWVHALGTFAGELVAGGEFVTAGGEPAAYIARWDGASWSAFENGFDLWTLALREHGGDLYAGGWFTSAGTRPSFYIARWLGEGTTDGPAPPWARPVRASLGVAGAHPMPGRVALALALPGASIARLTIHDAGGRRVATLLEELLPPGRREAVWSGRDDAGRPAAPGVYFARLRAEGEIVSARFLLLR
ncbi:MAG: hypothetical protein FJY75_01495 [Candidatus Eisenbacteria bacterium]|uniref:FlgD/Vpr Ig-like domain-containing protein n=1 Tax=Eiseniibacteriota bacterium TaxID=2212470 RepID=A0A938BMU0_UNCEI|nr:hypothetical protein [Candidatus Eisenbacteria bacterium]